jgi:hypothetical protein
MNSKSKVAVRMIENDAEMLDAIRGIQRGLDAMKEGKGEPARKALDRIRAKYKIPRRPK